MHFDNVFYRYTERAPLLGWSLVVLLGAVLTMSLGLPGLPYALLLSTFLFLAWLLYTSMSHTVEIASDRVIAWLGLPIDKVSFLVEDILEHRQIEISRGKGARRYRSSGGDGWRFGFWSSKGVLLRLRTGQQVIIGTEKPVELHAAITRATLQQVPRGSGTPQAG